MEKISEEISGGELLTEDEGLFSSGLMFDWTRKAGERTRKVRVSEFVDTLRIPIAIKIEETLEPSYDKDGNPRKCSAKSILCSMKLPFESGNAKGEVEIYCSVLRESEIQEGILRTLGSAIFQNSIRSDRER